MKQHLIPEMVVHELLLPYGAAIRELASGGLSGASIWCCDSDHGPLALRVWPTEHPSAQQLSAIHAAMTAARHHGLVFIPQIHPSRCGRSYLSVGNRLWELTEWMPGKADYLTAPNRIRLRAAMQALAELHKVWHTDKANSTVAPSPAMHHRLQRLQWACDQLPGWMQRSYTPPELQLLASATLQHLASKSRPLIERLKLLANVPVEVHFVLRDIWSDHLLLSENRVTGLIDFGAARVDEPATDIARLLGSLEPFDANQRSYGIDVYRERCPSLAPERVQVLDETSTLLSAVQWFQWLVLERREFRAPPEQLLNRWQQLLFRLELG